MLEQGEGAALVGLDVDGRIALWNPGAEQLTGDASGQLLGEPFSRLFPPEACERAFQSLREAESGGRDESEGWLVRQDGSRFRARQVLTALHDASGELAGFCWALYPLEPERQEPPGAEERLRLLESVVVHANDGVLVLEGAPSDGSGHRRIFYANAAFARMSGFSPEESIGRDLTMMVGPKTEPAALVSMSKAMEAYQPIIHQELLTYRKDGSTFWTESSLVPVKDGRGQRTHWVAIIRDSTERRRAEEGAVRLGREEAARSEAEAARARIEAILESITDAFFVLDREQRFTFVNQRAAQVLRRSREQLTGLRLEEVLSGTEIGVLVQGVRRVLSGQPAFDCELYANALGGWFECHVGHTPEGVSVYLREVTQRKRAEEARRRLTSIIEATPDFVGSTDAQGRGLYLNRAGRRMVGLSEEQDAAEWSIALAHPPWAARRLLGEGVPTALHEGVWTGETALRTPQGAELPVSQVLLAHRDAEGHVVMLSTIIRDITDRKLAEEAQQFLSESSRVLVAALEYDATLQSLARLVVPRLADFCMVAMREEDGLHRAVLAHRDPSQEPLLRRLGRTGTALNGRVVGVHNVVRTGEPELVPEVTDAWLRAASEDEEYFTTLCRLAPRSMMIVPLVARGRTLGVITFASTQSGRRYGQGDLVLAEGLAGRAALSIDNARLYREAQESSRARDEVLAVVSHDLRNPLNVIGLGAAALLKHLPEEGPAVAWRKQAETIRRSADRAVHLIEDLLDVAKIEAGRLVVQRVPEAVVPLLEEAIELHRPLAEARGLRLERESEEPLPRVLVERNRVLQVFSNLIGNALRFTPSGGRITVKAKRKDDGAVCFSVKDTGTGIAPEHVPHLFDRFWQAQGGREGAGLGLTISKGIIEAHGGTLWVESTPGQGSTFSFTLPVAGEARKPEGKLL
jgi:PAS domain S-box-containing protein